MRPPGASGPLIVIGGAEDRAGEARILRAFVQTAGGAKGRVVVVTVASGEAAAVGAEYVAAFRRLGAKDVHTLDIATRKQACDPGLLDVLDGAVTVFFTGGDQMRITSLLGGTPVYQRVHDIYNAGGVIAGTSAGASVMCETMMVSGDGDESHRLEDALQLSPGLGLIGDVIIDQHFAERGRMGRLLGAVCQNPRILGLGIDENTAVVVE